MTYRGVRRGLPAAAAAAMLLAGATPVEAQQVYAPAGRWTIDYGETRCSLVRRLGGAASPVVILSTLLGSGEPEFLLVQDGDEALPNIPSQVKVVLSPGDQAEVARTRRQGERGRTVVVGGLKEGFLDRFAAAQAVRFQSGSKVLLNLPTPGASRAVAVLNACNDDLMNSWGIDTAARVTFKRQARQVAGRIDYSDYPAEAYEVGGQGVVVVTFIVGSDGRLSECRTAVSSRVPVLDQVTCSLITSRFKYEPALNARGEPVAVRQVRTVRWILPSD